MSETVLTYITLRNELLRRALQYTFTGPHLLVWSVGLVIFLMVFERTFFALLWSGAMVALGFLMAADYLRSPTALERLIRSIVQKRFRVDELTDGAFKASLVFTEIAIKIYQIDRKRGRDAHLRRLIPLTHSMVSLLRDSASEAEELERGLRLANGSKPEGGDLQNGKLGGIPGRQREGTEDIRREINQARSSVDEILQHLETLMLKVFQVEQLRSDPVRNFEFARETDEIVTRLKRQLESRRADKYVSPEVQQTREALEAGFSEIDSSDGLRVLQGLVYEYVQLQPLLARRRATDTVGQIPHLVKENYRVGLGLLHDALELMRAVHPSTRRRLDAEVLELEKSVEAMRSDESQKERIWLMEATMSSHLERIAIMQKQESRVEELLHLAGRCEASLHRTRMELAALRTTDSAISVQEATESLCRTIEQAKEVQEELKKLGF